MFIATLQDILNATKYCKVVSLCTNSAEQSSDSNKSLVTSVPSICANKMAELSFMSVTTAIVNKTN